MKSVQRAIGAITLRVYFGLTALLAPLAGLLLRHRLARGREDRFRWREKLGWPGQPRPEGRLLWLHAVSVGEMLSIAGLLAELARRHPETRVLLTTSTVTAAGLAPERLPAQVLHQFLPLDTPGAVARFLDHWRPDAAVWVESELWPRLIWQTHRRGIPMLLVNARMSDRSARRWRAVPGAAAALLQRFRVVFAQDAQTAEHLRALGVPLARLRALGSLKETLAPLPFDAAERDRFRALWAGRPLWLAASTHAGEEAAVLQAHALARRTLPDLLLILAPRHPERGAALATEVAGAGLICARRSLRQDAGAGVAVYLADTLGELGLWFDLAPLAFIGGSLVPVGGHNAYEPVAQGAAVLHGPQIFNFRELYDRLHAVGGACEVDSAEALAAAVVRLLNDSAAAARSQAQAALAAIPAGGAAQEQVLAALAEVLGRA